MKEDSCFEQSTCRSFYVKQNERLCTLASILSRSIMRNTTRICVYVCIVKERQREREREEKK